MLDVAIVDDNYEFLVNMFNKINESGRYRVKGIYGDSKKAFDYIKEEKVDILILDLIMPGMDGIEFLQKLKEEKVNIKVIVISGDSSYILEVINKNLKVDEILLKPFTIDMLTEKLDSISDKMNKNVNIVASRLESILKNFGFSKANRGYYYITECLNYCIDMKYTYVNEIKELYKNVAKRMNDKVSAEKIEWNIYKALNNMNKQTNEEIMMKYFPYDRTPSPKAFINEILTIYYKNHEE